MVSKRKHIFYLIVGFNSFTNIHITIERYFKIFLNVERGGACQGVTELGWRRRWGGTTDTWMSKSNLTDMTNT